MAASIQRCACRIILRSRISRVQSDARTLSTSGIAGNKPETAPTEEKGSEDVPLVIPRKKKWDKLAVLRALSTTVKRDPTSVDYNFFDDPYLIPRTTMQYKWFSLAKESGQKAAEFFINKNPQFFQQDFAEPSIEAFLPKTSTFLIEEPCEEALQERMSRKALKAATEMYFQILDGGGTVSQDTTDDLLDLLCFHGSRDPGQETNLLSPEEQEEEPPRRKGNAKGRMRRANEPVVRQWREGDDADRLFNSLAEPSARNYCSLIKGLVKYEAADQAFRTYNDMQQKGLRADVSTYNALIYSVNIVRERYEERWDLIQQLLNQMRLEKIRPSLQTFNSTLRSLRYCGMTGRKSCLDVLREMVHLGIEPSMASYSHILSIFNPSNSPPSQILYQIMDEMEGKEFTIQDQDDGRFFVDAMHACLRLNDVELAYRLHKFQETGENWKLLGDSYAQSVYYGKFLNLICQMEGGEEMWKWYKNLVPSVYYPNVPAILNILRSLEVNNMHHKVTDLWEDIRSLQHFNKQELVEGILEFMAREKQTPEMQLLFMPVVQNIKDNIEFYYKAPAPARRATLSWSSASLSNLLILFLRAGELKKASEMLPLFKEHTKTPRAEAMEEYLAVCVEAKDKDKAKAGLSVAVHCGLPKIVEYAENLKSAMTEMEQSEVDVILNEELSVGAEEMKTTQ
ncbi:PTCD3 [Branchiostoma lanceolatum]|uniref:Small ribosomal subunit protein mS39 n=1 Tax=Branchiostoma lanceolatum TaxID=7740 RepID=A0A8J9ZLG0_BRALA|nr:PTCD3 [Branchiostoma lanceolatum]